MEVNSGAGIRLSRCPLSTGWECPAGEFHYDQRMTKNLVCSQ